jgi:putative flippase GtrA
MQAAPLPAASVLRFGRHQVGALVSTAIDFGTMTLVVSGLGGSAVLGTVIGASAGAVSNFWLGRTWIFHADGASRDRAGGQAWRYALVSFLSLVWNALGEHLLSDRLGLQYQLARVIVAVVVSVAWNFPMHRRFVFAAAHPARTVTP